jgi:hypothetical protein
MFVANAISALSGLLLSSHRHNTRVVEQAGDRMKRLPGKVS